MLFRRIIYCIKIPYNVKNTVTNFTLIIAVKAISCRKANKCAAENKQAAGGKGVDTRLLMSGFKHALLNISTMSKHIIYY